MFLEFVVNFINYESNSVSLVIQISSVHCWFNSVQ